MSELRQAKARHRAMERAAAESAAAFIQGESAALAGADSGACPLRKPALRNAWLRGHQAGIERMERRSAREVSPADRDERLRRLAALRRECGL